MTNNSLVPRAPIHDGHAGRRNLGGGLGLTRWLRGRADERRYQIECSHYIAAIRGEWRDTCEALHLSQWIDTPTGFFVRTPRVGHVDIGPPTTLVVELMPGQRVADLHAKGGQRLAESLGAVALRIEPIAMRWVRVTLLEVDPLADGFHLPPLSLSSAAELLLIGRTEEGDTLGHSLLERVHIALQGMSQSGKSSFCRSLLAPAAAAPDVIVGGIDHTDLLLGRPWDGTRHRAWQSTGLDPADLKASMERHAAMIRAFCTELRHRQAGMGRYEERVTLGPATPVLVCVLEEYPQFLALLDSVTGGKNKGLSAEVRGMVQVLAAEGLKYGLRLVMIAQRFEGDAIGGVYIRDQFGLKISFRVPKESVAFLHGDDTAREWGPEHATADEGVALLTGTGRPIQRVRVPYLGTYAQYVQRIETTAGGWS